jgi:hypothetical protein
VGWVFCFGLVNVKELLGVGVDLDSVKQKETPSVVEELFSSLKSLVKQRRRELEEISDHCH